MLFNTVHEKKTRDLSPPITLIPLEKQGLRLCLTHILPFQSSLWHGVLIEVNFKTENFDITKHIRLFRRHLALDRIDKVKTVLLLIIFEKIADILNKKSTSEPKYQYLPYLIWN